VNIGRQPGFESGRGGSLTHVFTSRHIAVQCQRTANIRAGAAQ
jgi:hypothetical protein